MKHFLTILLVALCLSAAAGEKPNIILILADDFGYECVRANGGRSYQTPNLDKLAATGMRFENCYAQPLCTPTRVQLMTGKYNVRNYTRFAHMSTNEVTFAHLLKKGGYRTAMAGKWQLGGSYDTPGQLGFDEYCLWQLNRRPSRYANPGLERDGKQVNYQNGEYGPDLINDYAIDFIKRKSDKPFFLYYSMLLTHAPFVPTPDSMEWDATAPETKAKKNPAHFADMVAYMDKLIGKLVASLEQTGQRENTLILFIGDNGTGRPIHSRFMDKTIQGGKGLTTKAGMHVPLIANWPAVIQGKGVCKDLVDTTDFLPTICEAIANKPPADSDGRSFLPQLRGEKGNPREWVYCWYGRNGGATPQKEFAANHRYKLYSDGRAFDIVEDPTETQPLQNIPPDTSKILKGALAQFKNARPARLLSEAGAGAGEE